MPTIATAGHVDHGKSTLVQALTGQDPDRLAEEKSRGLTIDLGFAWMKWETELGEEIELAFVDVPGHSKFVGNMLAGAASVVACLFVVSAKEKMMPQSWEHLHILELFGLSHGVVALTNVGGFETDELGQIQSEIKSSLAGTFLENAEIVQTDKGVGVKELKAALKRLVEEMPEALDLGTPRFWVDRSFLVSGSGVVVTGTLTLGDISIGDELLLISNKESSKKLVKVREIESLEKSRQKVGPDTRTALNLTGSTDGIKRGDILVKPDKWFLTKSFDASFIVLPLIDSTDKRGVKLIQKGAYTIYFGTGNFPIRIQILGKDNVIKSGETKAVRIFLDTELPLKLGDKFIVRDVGRDRVCWRRRDFRFKSRSKDFKS